MRALYAALRTAFFVTMLIFLLLVDESRSVPTATSFRDLAVGTLDARRKQLKESSGRQPGDPIRAADAIIKAVESDDPPLHLVLGKMALDRARETLTRRLAIFEEWVRRDVGRVFVQQFDIALERWCGLPASRGVGRDTCGQALAGEHNGDLYSCDHFVYPQYRLGNLLNASLGALVDSAPQQAFGDAKRDGLPPECVGCDVRFACHGECPKHRFLPSRDGRRALNRLGLSLHNPFDLLCYGSQVPLNSRHCSLP